MSCGCDKVEKTPLWSAIPPFRQPTDIQPGENIECYAKRSGSQSGQQFDNAGKPKDRIDNTSFTSDLSGSVDITFTLTPASVRIPTQWSITINGEDFSTKFPELSIVDSSADKHHIVGIVSDPHLNISYNVLVVANDSVGQIDSRAFTFFPKKGTKDNSIKFVIPLIHQNGVVITSPYGPRAQPAPGASTFHRGLDFAVIGNKQGTIVSSADGIVVKAGSMSGFGIAILIEHFDAMDRLVATSLYGHINEGNLFVSPNDRVSAGQKIALEGNNGIGSGMHLHFEIHKGKWAFGAGVDPMPYLNGAIPVASDTGAPDIHGNATPTELKTQSNSNSGMTTPESIDTTCPSVIPNKHPNQILPVTSPTNEVVSVPTSNTSPNRSVCAGTPPPPDEIIATIVQVCADEGLDEEETKFIKMVAIIESGLDPFAKNPTSSAMGLFQFLDPIAVAYFNKIGEEPSCTNRCDPVKATKTMIRFFKDEFRPIWNGFVNSGKTTIAGKVYKDTDWSRQYVNLSKNEFMYGLQHHDGIGNAINGIDLQGVSYWRSKVGTS